MNQAELDKVTDKLFAGCKELLTNKGADYSRDSDRISNFKVNAERIGLKPIQVWAIYFEKHINAIEAYVMRGELKSETIESRIQDAINYLVLLAALVKESTGVTTL